MAEYNSANKFLTLSEQDGKSSSSGGVRSKVLYFSTLTLATFLMIAEIIISALSGLDNADDFGFKNTTGNISDEYSTQITPAGWTFSIWSVIYAWQMLWLIYAWTFVCRLSQPRTIPWITFAFHAFSSVCTITWLYVWGNDYPRASFAVIIVIGLALYAAEGFAAVYMYQNSPKFNKIENVFVNVLITNGIGIYSTWVTFATLANFAIVLQYFAGADAAATGTAMLCILTVEVVAYFVLENTILDRYARYAFIVYPVFIWALAGVLSKQWGIDDRQNPIFTLVLEILVSILFVARIVLLIVFYFFRPLPTPPSKENVLRFLW